MITKDQTLNGREDVPVLRSDLVIFAFVAPSTLLILAFIALAIVNLVFNPTFWMTPDTEPITPTPFVIAILNVGLLIIGMIGLVSLLPGMITGLLLLVKYKRAMHKIAKI